VDAILIPEHFITADGSSTLVLPGLNEQYHSINGAIQESKVVYIDNGLNFFSKGDINILEIGFGTGLNCLLSYAACYENKMFNSIDYTAIEPFPLPSYLLQKLNYTSQIHCAPISHIFHQIHTSKPGEKTALSNHFKFNIVNCKVQEFKGFNAHFDLIYFDAFGPNIQPEMWSKEILKNMFDLLKNKGILVTYCAKGEVKRLLKEVGFIVEGLPGPPGKREVTRARKLI
jgi:tRNA U34 5-methylaminomethyl-2-thiouridine-forming methyltransferase MnmC